jgi:hypothetical protein
MIYCSLKRIGLPSICSHRLVRHGFHAWPFKTLRELLVNFLPTSVKRHEKDAAMTHDFIRQLAMEIQIVQEQTDRQLKALIGYNQNRDKELDFNMQTAFFESLLVEELQVEQVRLQYIYNSNGREVAEWDGVFYVTFASKVPPRLFFLESKQVFSLEKYKDSKRRMQDTINLLNSIDFEDPIVSSKRNFSKMRTILRKFFGSGVERPQMALVVCSPVIEQDLTVQLEEDGTSSVTFPHDRFIVQLRGM